MKIQNHTTSDVEIYGELKQNRVSIDVKNIDFITQILSTNLYSKPLNSFLRETISNAIDSHKEAGTKDPIILDIGNVSNSASTWYIRIQDFGTGISPERFDNIYRFIGSSTKRDSNEYIGAFGIGKYSVLAVSDSATLTNRYNGKEYKYLLYKDGMAVNIDELSISDTNERNGLEVYCQPSMAIEYDSILKALKELVFFEGVYISNNLIRPDKFYSYTLGRYQKLVSYINKFNERKIFHYKTFSCVTVNSVDEQSVLLGNVLYQVDFGHRDKNGVELYRNSNNEYVIFPRFNIGEISVTPNREAILYDNSSEEILNDKYVSVRNEIDEICRDKYNSDMSIDLINIFQNSKAELILNKDCPFINITIDFDKICQLVSKNAKIYGRCLNTEQVSCLGKMIQYISPFYTSHISKDDKITTKELCVRLTDIVQNKLNYKHVKYYRCGFYKLGYYLKQYIKDNYDNFVIIKPYSQSQIVKDAKFYNPIQNADKLVVAIYKKLCVDMWNNLPVIDESLVTDEFKVQYSRKNTYISEYVNVSTYSNGKFCYQRKEKPKDLLNSPYVYIYFTESENIVPIQLSNIPKYILSKDEDINSEACFIQVSEKTKKILADGDNCIDYNQIINPSRYWMRFLKTWPIVIEKLKHCYYKITDSTYINYNCSKEVDDFVQNLKVYNSAYSKIKCLNSFIKPFDDKIEVLDELVELMIPKEDIINTALLNIKLYELNNLQLMSLLIASVDGLLPFGDYKNKLDIIVKQYQIKQYDKEYNQDKQVPECNA